ncbi:alpha/beta hydrolase [Streptomyces sp. NPDC048717]|uniref:alpha/beta hydrolase n=1 Tax=Streptomyces sp. NPDC048717 TaxID=3154928 RepID=UPI0034123706
MVAPADVEAPGAPEAIRAQAPLPRAALGSRTHMVVSDNDPFLSLERGLALAESWGNTIEVVSGGRHLATPDGYGRWDHVATLIARHSATTLVPRAGSAAFAR